MWYVNFQNMCFALATLHSTTLTFLKKQKAVLVMEGTEEEEAFNKWQTKERATCNNFIKSEDFVFEESPRMIGTNKIVAVANNK